MIPKNEENRRHLVSSREDRERFLADLVARSVGFLTDEVNLPVTDTRIGAKRLDKLGLRQVTSIITVEDYFKLIVALSFDRSLLEAVFANYAEGLTVAPEEYEELMEGTAGDMINIVLGNALADFQQRGYAFSLSTPIIISEAKSILRYKESDLITAEIETGQGALTLLCISPGAYYGKDLGIEVPE